MPKRLLKPRIVTVLLFFILNIAYPAFSLNAFAAGELDKIAQFFALKDTTQFTYLNVKGYQQTEDYTCAPAAVMSLMHYYGKLTDKEMTKEKELAIAKEMGTTIKDGTTTNQVIRWLKKNGFSVKAGNDGTLALLRANLKKGIPMVGESPA